MATGPTHSGNEADGTADRTLEQPVAMVDESDAALLTAIVRSTNEAIVSVDQDGRITSWNDGAEHLYGYTAKEALGSPLSMLSPPVHQPVPAMQQAVDGRSVVYTETERLRRDGTTVSVGETLSPLIDLDGKALGLVTISRDISDRRRAEEALARVQRELESRNEKLERSNRDLEQFAYIASHDLSEPLRAVAGMVSLLSRRYQGQLDGDADEFITFAVEGCERMRAMIEDLLKFSRAGRTELHLEQTEIAEVVGVVVASLQHQIDDAGATVTTDDLPAIVADGPQLAQVFQNLISNAIKFRRPDTPCTVRISGSKSGQFWRFEVADNGIGIDEAYRERIFRMFQRLHPNDAYEGTGIGLAISERIVQRHGGSMGVDATPGGGSTFWFTSPESPQEAA